MEQSNENNTTKAVNISLTSVRKILKASGIDKIKSEALLEVRNIVQDIVKEIATNSQIYLRHRKGKILSKEDVLLAIK